MSTIGAPPSNLDTYGKHQVADPYGAQDPYGMGGMGGGEAIQTPEMQAYVQQLYYYHTMYQQMLYTATDPNQINQLRQYDAQVLQYLQQVGAPPPQEGVPFGGDPNAVGPEQAPSQYCDTPPDYQTKDYVVFEEGATSSATIDRQDPDKREANYYQPVNVCHIPSNAATVKVTMQPDDANPADQMAVVEITFKNPDGSEEKRIVKYHGANREGFQLAIDTPSSEQTDLTGVPEDLQDKIKWGPSAEPEQLKGDPPTDMDGDTRVYDGQNFDLSPVPSGHDEQTTVMASGDVTLTPNSNTEYYTVELDAATGNYVIKVYSEGPPLISDNLKETITVKGDLINNINFAMDPTRIEFMGELGKGDGHEINENSDAGAKLHMTGEETTGLQEGQPMNPESPADTPVDQLSTDGNTATFNSSENVELTNYPPPKGPDTVNITAPGEVIIHKNSYDDSVVVTKSGDTYTIVVTDAETGEETTYKVKGPPTNIVLDFLPENISGSAENDPLIQQGSTPLDAAQMLEDLAGLSGKTTQEVTTAILSAYPSIDTDGNGQLSTEEVNAAKAAGTFPPLIPDSKFAEFLYNLDPGLKSLLDQMKTADGNGRDLIIGPLRDRMVSLLGKFYSPVTPGATDTTGIDNLRIGSTEYDFISPSLNGDYGTYKWSNDDFSGDPWDILNFATQASQ